MSLYSDPGLQEPCATCSLLHALPDLSYIFVPVLINSQVDGPKRSPPQLLLDLVLVDSVYSTAIVLAVCVLGVRMKRFLHQLWAGEISTMVTQWAFVTWRGPA